MWYLTIVTGELGNKFGKEESIQKLDKCRALFQNQLLVTQDPWLHK